MKFASFSTALLAIAAAAIVAVVLKAGTSSTKTAEAGMDIDASRQLISRLADTCSAKINEFTAKVDAARRLNGIDLAPIADLANSNSFVACFAEDMTSGWTNVAAALAFQKFLEDGSDIPDEAVDVVYSTFVKCQPQLAEVAGADANASSAAGAEFSSNEESPILACLLQKAPSFAEIVSKNCPGETDPDSIVECISKMPGGEKIQSHVVTVVVNSCSARASTGSESFSRADDADTGLDLDLIEVSQVAAEVQGVLSQYEGEVKELCSNGGLLAQNKMIASLLCKGGTTITDKTITDALATLGVNDVAKGALEEMGVLQALQDAGGLNNLAAGLAGLGVAGDGDVTAQNSGSWESSSGKGSSGKGSSSPSCFPRGSTVQVLGKEDEAVAIEDVKVGDKIMTGQGFSEVYAFASRYDYHDETSEYLQFHFENNNNKAFEISRNHIIFVGADKTPKLATDVSVGDSLLLSPSNVLAAVKSIVVVSKRGEYAPITRSGTVVVNGVLASSHTTEWAAAEVRLFGSTVIDMHTFNQMRWAPLRVMCSLQQDLCAADHVHDDEGTHHWEYISQNAVDMLMFDAAKYEETNFLSTSVALPFKMLFFLSMVAFQIMDVIMNLSLASILVGCAVVVVGVLAILSPYGISVKADKKKMKKVV
eukprot:CAMPEP_0178502694 /NCGR_PEP_ID=MMETSP0696-20121128/17641_1 /TAXON_ID=265572 /ORGANISM="Extubocellulus spinifer, Strain CCMP396" /LENGTH=651 /DNA_ID=CAMNT_0020131769 /DNA_START=77 /DNA_END=2032 /DNA_ORIENTATION=-